MVTYEALFAYTLAITAVVTLVIVIMEHVQKK